MNADQRQSAIAAARRGAHGGAPASQRPFILTAKQKRWISGLIALHLVAVVTGPLAAPPSSELFGKLWDGMQWYVEPMFLNHGYRFFGPDPGPSHLVEYEVELPDGERIAGRFPNLDEHQPRLFYHRHFMLTERLQAFPDSRQPPGVMWAAGGLGGLTGEAVLVDMPGDPPINALALSYARHLYHKHQARRVRLTLVRHLIPEPEWVIEEGMRLNDPRLFRRWLLIEYTGEDNPDAASASSASGQSDSQQSRAQQASAQHANYIGELPPQGPGEDRP